MIDLYKIAIICVASLYGCSNNAEGVNEIASFYEVGMFEAVVEISERDNQYLGMIYEYELLPGYRASRAKEIYKNIDDEYISNKRLFLYCYLYCQDELDVYFEALSEYQHISLMYAMILIDNGYPCFDKLALTICEKADAYYKSEKGGDVYYKLGMDVHQAMVEEEYERIYFEYPFYLFMKSYIDGNEKAMVFINNLPDSQSWKPIKVKDD